MSRRARFIGCGFPDPAPDRIPADRIRRKAPVLPPEHEVPEGRCIRWSGTTGHTAQPPGDVRTPDPER
jgi:hypothetical protein